MLSLFNEWIKSVLFLLSLNTQANKFGFSFLREMSFGAELCSEDFFFFFRSKLFGYVFEVTVGWSLFKPQSNK